MHEQHKAELKAQLAQISTHISHPTPTPPQSSSTSDDDGPQLRHVCHDQLQRHLVFSGQLQHLIVFADRHQGSVYSHKSQVASTKPLISLEKTTKARMTPASHIHRLTKAEKPHDMAGFQLPSTLISASSGGYTR
ncbi:hypothetical protein HGRIS_004358 [Hohenbuehelia grisea]|uniref:Uncharacterized protein n=1 Tax=Hohenbuehelia grisea TaxID=104357 RepID=A0ABR3JC68_9AGAR